MVKKTFQVLDMHCTACVMRLEELEDQLAGVNRVTASYHKQQIDVEYDESQVTEQDILTAVQQQGYNATPL